METNGWLIDPKRCIECRACEAACKQWNGVETGVGVRLRQVRVYESGAFPAIHTQALSGACNHCEVAYCMMVCPVKAIWRRTEDGTVQIDRDKCVSCRQCASFCPYGAPQFNLRTRKMEKCTGCFDRVEMGLQPACAAVCPTGALQWGKWTDLAEAGAATVDHVAPPYTRPHLRFVTEAYPAAG